jgi:hypothetical protein
MVGVLAAFNELDSTTHAIEELKRNGFNDFDVYSPTPRHELEHAVHPPVSKVRMFTLIGGLLGATFGYWVAVWTSDYWPLVVGGKAIASWIPYTIIGFEMMVLVGGLSSVAGMFILGGLPRLTKTVGYDVRFSNASFGIFVRCAPDKAAAVENILHGQGAAEVRRER